MTPSSSRTVRVFLSSTFRDFAEERDLLVKKVFPELRRRCRERQVELVDVDLRWGITEEQAQRGEVLPICLAEIDRSRPYFMGFIGDRYGWVPEKHQYDLSLLVEQPWLDEHRGGKSVTELEMLHGVLNNPQMKDRAFFYFRNSEYSQSKGGPYLSEGPESALKLEALKDRIRTSGFPVVENYPNPEALAEKVQEDLWRVIDETFPEEDVPDPLTLERRKHEAYGGSRLGLYLGGKQYFTALDTAMTEESFKPVLITGASGGGKSALIANWSKAYKERHPETLEIIHYLGSGADAADPMKLLVRLMKEIARIENIVSSGNESFDALWDELKLESDPQKIIDALPEWLARASSYAEREAKEWLILLDGLDKLSSLRDLRWWPGFLPPRVKLVVSCLDGEVQEEARRRMEWTLLEVHPFSPAEQREFITEYLGKYRKSLKPEQVARVQEHSLSGNPLFLRTLLEELRIFGVHEELEKKITWYLESQTVDQLFAKVLERVEGDTEAKAVRAAMEAIWASRAGLAQDELLAITGLVPATWAPIHNSLDEAIFESGGRIQFGHDYVRKAVEDRYLATKELQKQAHARIAEWFEKHEPTHRVAEELPWQWEQAGEKEKLTKCLLSREIFILCFKRDEYELLSYWLWSCHNISQAYEGTWGKWSNDINHENLPQFASCLGNFLKTAGYNDNFTEFLYRYAQGEDEKRLGLEHPNTLNSINNLANLLQSKGEYKEAGALHRQALSISEKALGPEHHITLNSLNNLANLLHSTGDYKGAEEFHRRAFSVFEKEHGEDHSNALMSLNNLGNVLCDEGHYEEAEAIFRRVLKGKEKVLGLKHPETLTCISSLGVVLQNKGDYEGAKIHLSHALECRKKLLGPDHPNTLVSIDYFGGLLTDIGELVEAESLLRHVLERRENFFGPTHLDTLLSIISMGDLLRNKGDYDGAETLYWRALKGYESSLGPDHPSTIMGVHRLGILLHSKGDYEGAESHYRRSLEWRENTLGREHPETIKSLFDFGALLHCKGDYEQAEPLYRRALVGNEKIFGFEHINTINTLCYLSNLLISKGDYEEAVDFMRRALEAREKVLGTNHPETLRNQYTLGEVIYLKKDYHNSELIVRESLLRHQNIFGNEHPGTIACVLLLGKILKNLHSLKEASLFLRRHYGLSKHCAYEIRYNLACYECLEGNIDEAKRLIAEHLKLHPEKKEQALKDSDFEAIKDFIETL